MNLANLVSSTADRTPDALAVEMGSQSLTYRQFVDEGARVSAGLASMGVAAGDRVMLFAENCVEYLVLYHAVARIGAVFVPVHASFQVNELEYVLSNAKPVVVIAHDHLWERLDRCAGGLPAGRIALGSTSRQDVVRYDELGTGVGARVVVDVEPSSPALICYTSGTTDRPQPVTRSHQTEIWNAQSYADVWDYQDSDRALVALPLSWVYGLSTLAQGLLTVGATIVIHADFSATAVIDEIERTSITLFAGTMSMYVALLGALQRRDADLTSLRHLYRGGEPPIPSVVSALENRVGVRLSDGYAATEVAPVLAVDPVRDHDAPVGTAGRLVPGAQIRIVDEAGADVTPGEVGEAWLGGPGLMLGYWNEPQLTAQRVTPDGWFRSGDLLRQGDDGYFFVMGRFSETIIRDGARVAPAEIETALVGLPGIADSVTVGVPDPEFGESIVAFVVVEPDCVVTVDDIYVYLADRIARFKLPTDIILVDEIPLRQNAKRDRRALRRVALELLGDGAGDPVVSNR
jgi:acyl-CoA synthetase (AMP-forming)/AMP-acid ligase II